MIKERLANTNYSLEFFQMSSVSFREVEREDREGGEEGVREEESERR